MRVIFLTAIIGLTCSCTSETKKRNESSEAGTSFPIFQPIPQTSVDKAYYVSSQTGSDSGTGSKSSPFKTLQKCLNQWKAGKSHGCFASGIFTEALTINVGGPSNKNRNLLTLWDKKDGGPSGNKLVIDGQNNRSILLKVSGEPDNIEISHATFQNAVPGNGNCSSGGAVHFIELNCSSGGCNDWFLHRNTFSNLAPSCSWDTNGSSYIAIRPTGAGNMWLERNTFSGIGGYIMRYFNKTPNLVFYKNSVRIASAGIKVWGTQTNNHVYDDNEFSCDGNGNVGSGNCLPQSGITLANDSQGTIIRNNRFSDCVTAIGLDTDTQFGYRPQKSISILNNSITSSDRVCNPYAASIALNSCGGMSQLNDQHLYLQDIHLSQNTFTYNGAGNQGAAIAIKLGGDTNRNHQVKIQGSQISNFRFGLQMDSCPHNFNIRGLSFLENTSSTFESHVRLGFSQWQGPTPTDVSFQSNTYLGSNSFYWLGDKTFNQWKNLGFDSNSVGP